MKIALVDQLRLDRQKLPMIAITNQHRRKQRPILVCKLRLNLQPVLYLLWTMLTVCTHTSDNCHQLYQRVSTATDRTRNQLEQTVLVETFLLTKYTMFNVHETKLESTTRVHIGLDPISSGGGFVAGREYKRWRWWEQYGRRGSRLKW